MSGRQARKARRAVRRAEEAYREGVRDDLRRHASDHGGSTVPRFLRGFSWMAVRIRWQQLSLRELLRFLTARCLYCGRSFTKRSFGHDCHTEVCMHAMIDRLMRRKGHDFPGNV